jgi:hypothetical protein
MKKLTEQLVNKDQLEHIYAAWGVAAAVPSKGSEEVVCFPNQEYARISFTPHKSDYGKRLYRIDFFA